MQLRKILTCLSRVRIGKDGGALDYLENLSTRMFPSKALLIMVSPLTNRDWSLFPRLKMQGYQVVLISPNPINFTSQYMAINNSDKEFHLALRAAAYERQLLIRNILRLEIPVIDWKVDQPLSPLVRHTLCRPLLSRRGW